MSQTEPQANNKAIVYEGKGSRMRKYADGTSDVTPMDRLTDPDGGQMLLRPGISISDARSAGENMGKALAKRDFQQYRDPSDTSAENGPHYAKGTAKVPGKGDQDSVPAKLTPGEAVLTKGAAKAVGRDEIARLNAKAVQSKADALRKRGLISDKQAQKKGLTMEKVPADGEIANLATAS